MQNLAKNSLKSSFLNKFLNFYLYYTKKDLYIIFSSYKLISTLILQSKIF